MFKCYGTRLTMSGCQEYQILEVSICQGIFRVSECQFGRFGANETVDKMLIEGAPSAPSFLLFFVFSVFFSLTVSSSASPVTPSVISVSEEVHSARWTSTSQPQSAVARI